MSVPYYAAPCGSRPGRRSVLALLACAPLSALVGHDAVRAQTDVTILAVPGPRSSVSLPLELAVRLGLDKAEGLPIRLKFVGGGGVAIQELRSGNAEFGVFGLPAMLRANLTGQPRLMALASIDDLPLYTLVVRSDLRGQVRSVRDLRGRTLGVHSDSLSLRTTSHQVAEYLLQRSGVPLAGVKFIAAGQSWDTQSSMLVSRAVDATLCDEPFATRMESEGLAFRLFSTGSSEDVRSHPGLGFLRAVLIGRAPDNPKGSERAARAVAVVRRTLQWIASHSAAEMADALVMEGAERESFLSVARLFPRQYSADGKFSTQQLLETELFFRAVNADLPNLDSLRWPDMVQDRWAGRKP